MIRPRPMLSLALLSVMAGLIFSGGCDDHPTLPCNYVAAGRLQGMVQTGGLPSASVIMATRVTEGLTGEPTFETSPDETGAYVLDLPAGDYFVQLLPSGNHRFTYDYSVAGLGYGQFPPDTLQVNETVSPVVVDFDLGSLTLHLYLSDLLDGERCEIMLYKRDAVLIDSWRTYLNQSGAIIENGQVDIQAVGLLPGEYKVEIILGRFSYSYEGERFWMPGTREESESPWYEVGADSVVALECSITTEPAHIEGRISGAWLSMGLSEPPDLSIVAPDSVTIIDRHRVSADGRFAVDIFLPGPVKILVTQDGMEQWMGGPGFAEAEIFDLQPGETITDIDLVQCGLRLNVDSGGLWGFYGYEIRFHDPTDMETQVTFTQWGGFSGLVPVTNLWPGEFFLYITPEASGMGKTAWRPQWYDRGADPAAAQLVSFSSGGEVVWLDIVLERGGTISGRLETSSPDGNRYNLIATPADEYLCWGSNYIHSGNLEYILEGIPDGRFKFGAVPIGSDWAVGGPPPAGTIWYPGTGNWDAAEIVEIVDGADLVGLNIQID